MKLKNILIPFLALAAMVGCTTEDPLAENFSEVSIEPSYVGFTAEGGSIDAEVTASVDWAFDTASLEAADWLEVAPTSGAAGTTPVKFTVKKNEGSSKFEVELKVVAGGKTQFVKVSQAGGAGAELVITSVKDVLAAEVGKVFNVEGVVSNITNTLYGNLDITDETGTIYIYGFLDKNGEPKHFSDLKIEDGDRIIINGPRDEYHGNAQMKNVSLVKIVKKSLIKLEATEFELTKEAQQVLVKGTFKSNDINVENNNDWVTFKGVDKNGENATITFAVDENIYLCKRTAKIVLKSGEDSKTITISQEPRPATPEDIHDASIKDVLEADTDARGPYYRISGVIKNIAMDRDDKTKQDGKGKFTLVDGTGEIYVYGLTATDLIGQENDKSFPSLGLQNGDYVTIIGPRGEHNGNPQLTGPAYHVSHVSAKPATIKEFLAGTVGDRNVRSILTGKVSNIKMDKKDPTKPNPYGNFTLTDEAGDQVYVYGLVNGPSYYEKDGELKFSNNQSFPELGITEGATISIVSVLGAYNNNKQAVESYLNPAFKIIPGEGVVKPVLEESFMKDQGAFSIETKVGVGEKSPWKHGEYDGVGYMKASGFIDNSQNATEAMLVSPVISLKDRKEPVLNFEQTGKRFDGTNFAANVSLLVKEKGGEWVNVEIPTWMTGNDYNYIQVAVSLKAYAGKEIQFAFKYVSSPEVCPTWQLRNVSVK